MTSRRHRSRSRTEGQEEAERCDEADAGRDYAAECREPVRVESDEYRVDEHGRDEHEGDDRQHVGELIGKESRPLSLRYPVRDERARRVHHDCNEVAELLRPARAASIASRRAAGTLRTSPPAFWPTGSRVAGGPRCPSQPRAAGT
jgi:hypothetical protein